MYSLDYPSKLREEKAEQVVYNYINMMLFIAIRTYDRTIFEQEHILDKFRQEREI